LHSARHRRVISHAQHARRCATPASTCFATPGAAPTIRQPERAINSFLKTLDQQRCDDHRYYHQSRINQSLHLVSAISFVCAYGLLFIDPALAALVGWGVSMVTRQAGHFFFEPKGYDHANDATHEYKEAIKVGYNLRRKVVLMSAWALSPALL